MPRRNTKKTSAEFIREARAVHGTRYGYAECVYQSAHSKLTVVCRVHGAFQISANSHLQGSGCRQCNGGGKLTSAEFVARARAVHGHRYRYDGFSGLEKKIRITCIHGTTRVRASSHLAGTQCPECRAQDRLENFVAQARQVHGNRYDYSQTIFEHCDQKVDIICREHGLFQQSPHNHLQNHGCPKCAKRSTIKQQS